MNDIMLDIETMATANNAVITQIGACYFNRETGEVGEKFLINVSMESCVKYGLVINAETVAWWFSQKENVTFLDNPQPLHVALAEFSKFVKYNTPIWSHATFDFVVVMNAFRAVGLPAPMHYTKARDIRTLVDLTNDGKWVETEKNHKTHNALDDCLCQVEYCTKCFNKLKTML